jgi:hypothetical protein
MKRVGTIIFPYLRRLLILMELMFVQVATRFKSWSAAIRLLGRGLESRRGQGSLSLVIVVCC